MREDEQPIAQTASTGPVCPQCGTNAPPGQLYCGRCGAPLPGGTAAPPDALARIPTATANPLATAEPLATATPALTGQGPQDQKKSWWGRRSRKAKVGLVVAGVAVLTLAAVGVVLSQVLPSSDTNLVQTLATTTSADTRHKAALDLAALHSVEATRDLAFTAETDDTARSGLEALGDAYIQELTALREKYVAQVAADAADEVLRETEDALTQTVDCLAVIEDARSAEALGEFICSGEAELAAARLHAVQAVAGMDPKLALPLLQDAATLRGHPGREIAEAALASLRKLPGATVAASTTTTARTTTTVRATTTTSQPPTTTTEPTTTTAAPTFASLKWGSPAEFYGLRVTVNEPSTNRELVYKVNGVASEDRKMIMAKVVAKNISSEPVLFDVVLEMTDSSEYRHWAEEDIGADIAKKWPPVPWGDQLEPGEGFTGYAFFDVPAQTAAQLISCYRDEKGPDLVPAIWGY